MTAFRSDIERALDELISNEEGMRFQGLAVVLAKLKWPEFIAFERKKDLGLDAYAPASLCTDGKGKGLACSTTATLKKIKDDIIRFRDHFSDIKLLIFSTPAKVSTETAQKWAETVRKDYKLDLIVVPREDILTDLMLPKNASICRTHLGLHVPLDTSITELVEKARRATSEVVRAWLAHPLLAERPKILLRAEKLDKEDQGTGEIFDLYGLYAALRESRRIVLLGPAGGGKTTTLVQLAELHRGQSELAFLIDLPEWIRSRMEFLDFIAGGRQFRSLGLLAGDLAKLYETVHYSILLNGWNELSDNYSEEALGALKSLEKNFPTAGIIVSTRTHHIRPPLPGAVRAKLLPLTRIQRNEYLQQRLPDRSADLTTLLDTDRVLDELTRTPFILSEVTTIFLSGNPIPSTKMGVLSDVMGIAERSDEHRDHLERQPVSGHSRAYLAKLAARMTFDGQVMIEETQARVTLHSVSQRLNAEGQIATPPEPAAILSTLCAHHVLERQDYPAVAFRFQHQQFQEFLVALDLKRQLFALVHNSNDEMKKYFTQRYVNIPSWEEPLRMIAEEIGSLNEESPGIVDTAQAGKILVEMGLSVDPVFAAELARLCGPLVWAEVRTAVGKRLRALYSVTEKHYRRCGLAGMLASGSQDFIDIVLPLLTDGDQQIRLTTYRAWHEFHVSGLGRDWWQIVEEWQEDRRLNFVWEVARERWMSDIAERFAQSDPSQRVKMVAIQALHWVGAEEALTRVLASVDDEVFRAVLNEEQIEVPPSVNARALTVYKALLTMTTDPPKRIRLLLAAAEVGELGVSERIKEELARWPPEQQENSNFLLLKSAVDRVRQTDTQWVSHWVAEQIVKGFLRADYWKQLLVSVPESMVLSLLDQVGSESLEYNVKTGITSVLAAAGGERVARGVFSHMCQLRAELSRESPSTHGDIFRQLEDILRAMRSADMVSGVVNSLADEFEKNQFIVVIELFGRVGNDAPEVRGSAPEDVRQLLRSYLKEGVSFLLSGEEDFDGALKGHLALALARVGDRDDIDDLHRLIQTDLERIRRGREARIKGERSPIANGAAMSWVTWYVRALVTLSPERAEDLLLQLLGVPEYEQEAAEALANLARTSQPERQLGANRLDYRLLWIARAGEQPEEFAESQRARYAAKLKEGITAISHQRLESELPDSFNSRLKGLCKILAVLDGRESANFVLDIMVLPAEWDGWTRVAALEALLFSGAQLNAELVLRILEPIIDYHQARAFNQQSAYLLQRCLCVLPFVEPASNGIARIKTVVATSGMRSYDLRELVTALGHSRSSEAFQLLVELARGGLQGIAMEWLDALAALGTAESRRVLFSFVDPEIENFGIVSNFEYHERERLITLIVGIAREDTMARARLCQLCSLQLPPEMRARLAEIVIHLGTRDTVLAWLNLIDDQATPQIPHGIRGGLETIFLERRSYDSDGGAYTVEPRSANEIRSRLFEMVLNDPGRMRSAWSLLGRIEAWRVEYGRPSSEPRHPAFDSGAQWPPIDPV